METLRYSLFSEYLCQFKEIKDWDLIEECIDDTFGISTSIFHVENEVTSGNARRIIFICLKFCKSRIISEIEVRIFEKYGKS